MLTDAVTDAAAVPRLVEPALVAWGWRGSGLPPVVDDVDVDDVDVNDGDAPLNPVRHFSGGSGPRNCLDESESSKDRRIAELEKENELLKRGAGSKAEAKVPLDSPVFVPRYDFPEPRVDGPAAAADDDSRAPIVDVDSSGDFNSERTFGLDSDGSGGVASKKGSFDGTGDRV